MVGRNTIRNLMAGLLLVCAGTGVQAQAPPKMQPGEGVANQKPSILDKVGIDQRLNQQVPLDLTFNDENGQPVELKQYFGSKPVILALVYFQCPMLCSQVQSGLVGALNGIVRFNVGRDFNVITVSFDPRDTPESATANKKSSMSRYRRDGAEQGWHFLTGRKEQIDALANAVGFHFKWDPQNQQFAHGSGIMLLTPDGRIARYYYGIEYVPRDIQFGLIEASQGKIGNLADQVLLYCYHYDPATGRYGAVIKRVLQLSAGATLLGLGTLLMVLIRWGPDSTRRSGQVSYVSRRS
jgi:protein SCO1